MGGGCEHGCAALPADLTEGLRSLKLATMRALAPELLLTAKRQRWSEHVADPVDIVLYDSFAQPESHRDQIAILINNARARRVVVYTSNFRQPDRQRPRAGFTRSPVQDPSRPRPRGGPGSGARRRGGRQRPTGTGEKRAQSGLAFRAHECLPGRAGCGVVAGADGGRLTAFQVVAQLFFGLPASDGFLLAGGGALLAQGLTARPTQDLDFFTRPGAGDVGMARDQLVAAAGGHGWDVDVVQDSDTFCRLLIHGPDDLLVDLTLGSAPGRPTMASIAGPTFAPAELTGRKVIALFDRAAPATSWTSSPSAGGSARRSCSSWRVRSTRATRSESSSR